LEWGLKKTLENAGGEAGSRQKKTGKKAAREKAIRDGKERGFGGQHEYLKGTIRGEKRTERRGMRSG